MGILREALEKRDTSLSLKDYEQWVELGLTSRSASGVSVTPSRAMQLSAVYACVRILAETVASLPLVLYERQAGSVAIQIASDGFERWSASVQVRAGQMTNVAATLRPARP